MIDLSKYAGALALLYTDEVYFFMPVDTGEVNSDGEPVTSWQVQPKVMGNIQNCSGDLAYQEYGIRVTCEKRIFLPTDTIVSEGWGVAFSAAKTEPELYVKWAPQNKTHRFILAGTR